MTSESVRLSVAIDTIAEFVDGHSRGEISSRMLKKKILQHLDPLQVAAVPSSSIFALLERVIICVLALRLIDRKTRMAFGRIYVHVKCLGCSEPMWTAERCPHFYCDDCAAVRNSAQYERRPPVASSDRLPTGWAELCYHGSDPDRMPA